MRLKPWPMFFLLAALLAAAALCAQTPDAVKRADTIRLLRLTGAAEAATQAVDLVIPSLQQAMPEVPGRIWQDFRAELKQEDMIELTADIWDKHFTDREIRDLLRFYKTSTGRKIIKETPAIQKESLVAGRKWGDEIVTRILARLREKGYQPPPGLE